MRAIVDYYRIKEIPCDIQNVFINHFVIHQLKTFHTLTCHIAVLKSPSIFFVSKFKLQTISKTIYLSLRLTNSESQATTYLLHIFKRQSIPIVPTILQHIITEIIYQYQYNVKQSRLSRAILTNNRMNRDILTQKSSITSLCVDLSNTNVPGNNIFRIFMSVVGYTSTLTKENWRIVTARVFEIILYLAVLLKLFIISTYLDVP